MKLRIEVSGGVVTAVYKINKKGDATLLDERFDYDLVDYDNQEADQEEIESKR